MENTYCDDFENVILTEDDYFREALNSEALAMGIDCDNRNECGHALNIIVQSMYTANAVLALLEELAKGAILPIIGQQKATLHNAAKTDKVAVSQGIYLKTLARYCFMDAYKKYHNSDVIFEENFPEELIYEKVNLEQMRAGLLQRCKNYMHYKEMVLHIAGRKNKIGFSENDKGIFSAEGMVWQLVRYDGYDFYKSVALLANDSSNLQSCKKNREMKIWHNFTPYSRHLQEQCEKEIKDYIWKNRNLLSDFQTENDFENSTGRV